MSMVYRPVKGAVINEEQAQRYGERISELEIANRDTEDFPSIVLEDARNNESPLNDYFEWDNEKAGYKYRRHQASMLLCSIEVQIISPEDNTEQFTRAFHPVKITVQPQEKDQKEYQIQTWTSKDRIFSDSGLRQQIILKALNELTTWQERYKQYSELSGIFNVIQEAKTTLNK